MIYRMRVYDVVRENLALFHEFFRTRLLPVQLRHGARLVGRWETDDGRVVAVWEYDDRAAYERIEAAVRGDPESRQAQAVRAGLPLLFRSREEIFMTATVPLNQSLGSQRGLTAHCDGPAAATAVMDETRPDSPLRSAALPG